LLKNRQIFFAVITAISFTSLNRFFILMLLKIFSEKYFLDKIFNGLKISFRFDYRK